MATLVARPGRNEIDLTNFRASDAVLAGKIEFHSGESVLQLQWVEIQGAVSSKKRGGKSKDPSFNEYLAILLDSGVILVYSPLTKDYINKITNELPLVGVAPLAPSAQRKYDLATYEANFGLKFYSSLNPQLMSTHPLKDVGDVRFIHAVSPHVEEYSLILCSDTALFLLDQAFHVKLTLQLPPNCEVPTHALFCGEDSLAITDGTTSLYIYNLAKASLATTLTTLTAQSPIITLDKISKELLSAVTARGDVELFNVTRDSAVAATKLTIQGGEKVGRFTKLVPFDESLQIFKGVWYDSFQVNVTDFEFEDIGKLEGEIPISVVETVEDVGEEHQTPQRQPFEVESQQGPDRVPLDARHACEDLDSLRDLLEPYTRTRLSDSQTADSDSLTSVLVQNTSFTKPYVHLLTSKETELFFANVAQCLSYYVGLGAPQNDSDAKSALREWFHWILLLRGAVVAQDSHCLDWLKLIQSGLNQDVRLLPQMLKLEGKLELLKDQLQLRRDISHNARSEQVLEPAEESVVFEGEGGFDDDEDEEDDNDDDDDEADNSEIQDLDE